MAEWREYKRYSYARAPASPSQVVAIARQARVMQRIARIAITMAITYHNLYLISEGPNGLVVTSPAKAIETTT